MVLCSKLFLKDLQYVLISSCIHFFTPPYLGVVLKRVGVTPTLWSPLAPSNVQRSADMCIVLVSAYRKVGYYNSHCNQVYLMYFQFYSKTNISHMRVIVIMKI